MLAIGFLRPRPSELHPSIWGTASGQPAQSKRPLARGRVDWAGTDFIARPQAARATSHSACTVQVIVVALVSLPLWVGLAPFADISSARALPPLNDLSQGHAREGSTSPSQPANQQTGHQVPSPWSPRSPLVPGPWLLPPSSWPLAHGPWFLAPGSWPLGSP